ncbi:MAG: replicative DNA helicase [Deltaproteobacteria bacterium]|jgi:replicative DNA helicase|nr:replicative DNA helicase [Deltaproteobacteria bacterium]
MEPPEFEQKRPADAPGDARVFEFAPHPDLEAERALLGSLIVYGAANMPEILDAGLQPADFYRDAHREIFAAIADLYNSNEPIDLITLSEKLRRRQTYAKVGGAGYLAELQDLGSSFFHSQSYARAIVDKSTLRRLMVVAAETTDKCQTCSSSAAEILDETEATIMKIRDSRADSDMVYVPDSLEVVHDQIIKLFDLKGALSGIPTGYAYLDGKTGGFQKSDLIVLGGRPGMGKTAMALNMALNVAIPSMRQSSRDLPARSVLIFSLEMVLSQILQRMICQVGHYDLLAMRTGKLSVEDMGRLTDTLSLLKEAPIYIDDSSSGQKLKPVVLRAKARRLQRQLQTQGLPNLGLIVVDYLQLMSSNEPATNREREVAEISMSLKNLAKELDVTVLCCSQLKRSDAGKPDLADLRDSGAIEQDADIVMFMLRPEVLKSDPELEGKAELQIKKHRNGPTATVHLHFLKHCSSFVPPLFESYNSQESRPAPASKGKKKGKGQ